MQALLIDPVAKSITMVDTDGRYGTMGPILGASDITDLRGGALMEPDEDGRTTIMALRASASAPDDGVFMITGVPLPVYGKVLLIGTKQVQVLAEDVVEGAPLEAPTVTAEWAAQNVLWLTPTWDEANQCQAFVCESQSPTTVLNVLRHVSKNAKITDMVSKSSVDLRDLESKLRLH